MSSWTPWLFICLLSIFALMQVESGVNLGNHKLNGIIKWKYEKRPFCNAFTGCGKKRTPYPPYALSKRDGELDMRTPYTLGNDEMADGLSDLIDINAEPAVENVQKQIMSQAKIYEAIKEASKEIFRQKNQQKLLSQQRQQLLDEQQPEPQDHGQQQLNKMEDGEVI